jgi:hypothetical protein
LLWNWLSPNRFYDFFVQITSSFEKRKISEKKFSLIFVFDFVGSKFCDLVARVTMDQQKLSNIIPALFF